MNPRHFLDYLEQVDPHARALEDDAVPLTYGQLLDKARRIAAGLHDQFGVGQYLLVPMVNDVASVATLLGAMYSGNTPIPLDPDLPPAAVDYVREKSHAVDSLTVPARFESATAAPRDSRNADQPAMVLFTSGTSGFPKGVLISHANLLHSCHAISNYLGYRQYPTAAVVLPLHYSYALLSQVCCILYVGGRSRLFADLRNPLKFARAVNDAGLETFCGVPSTYHMLCTIHSLSRLSMPSVRVLCSAGAAMDHSKYLTVKEIFPNAAFFNNYGMTEAAPRISFIQDNDPRFHEPTCGRPMEGVEVRVVDPETHQPLAHGQSGMLVVRGPNITAGYLNDPELTRAAFTRDGFLISGDVASLDDGYIMIQGRYDDVFNVGGEKVAPLEIERALNSHPAVELSAIVGVSDEQRGKTPLAFVKLRHSVCRKELVDHLARYLPKVKIPQRFLSVRSFPMTANGKLQRRNMTADDTDRVVGEIR